MLTLPLGKFVRITPAERAWLADVAKHLYVHERRDVRTVATLLGRSYGATYQLLCRDAQVTLRHRGGPRRSV